MPRQAEVDNIMRQIAAKERYALLDHEWPTELDVCFFIAASELLKRNDLTDADRKTLRMYVKDFFAWMNTGEHMECTPFSLITVDMLETDEEKEESRRIKAAHLRAVEEDRCWHYCPFCKHDFSHHVTDKLARLDEFEKPCETCAVKYAEQIAVEAKRRETKPVLQNEDNWIW